MKNKLIAISLATSTALTLSMTAAFADGGNEAYLDQNGSDNDALIAQNDGNDNRVGKATGTGPAVQEGIKNNLDITQSGDNNIVDRLKQSTKDDGSVTVNRTNIAAIEQSSDGNSVNWVDQRYSGSSTEAPNDLDILQTGGNDNDVAYAWQLGTANQLNILQSGTNNFLQAFQYGTGPTGYSNGNGNSADIIMTGNDNGRGSLTGDYSGVQVSSGNDGGPPWAKLSSGGVNQRGNDNKTDLTLAGNSNNFGVLQRGDRNRTQDVIITGDDNSFSSEQIGDDNRISLAVVAGFDNSIGFSQVGDDNWAQADIAGDFNLSRLTQLGDSNMTELLVDGSSNTADLDVVGDNNRLNAQQRFGSNNIMDVDVLGNNNNASGGFNGDAQTARNVGNSATSAFNFKTGSIWQHGSGNDVTLDVQGNDNLFATLQRGDDNQISGSVAGDFNMAVVYQAGGSNVATFTQMGSGNNAGILQ